MVLDHVGRLQVFVIDGVVLPEELQCELVMEVSALPPYMLVFASEKLHGFLAALAALLATRYPTLGLGQGLFRLPILARILDARTIRQRSERLQAEINARLPASERQGSARHISTGKANIPPVRLFADRDGLDGALDRPAPVHRNATDFGEH